MVLLAGRANSEQYVLPRGNDRTVLAAALRRLSRLLGGGSILLVPARVVGGTVVRHGQCGGLSFDGLLDRLLGALGLGLIGLGLVALGLVGLGLVGLGLVGLGLVGLGEGRRPRRHARLGGRLIGRV
ncbi:MAG: hypothetical protein ACRDRZ_05240, partial [Pseudonocardiaceae bacterium]